MAAASEITLRGTISALLAGSRSLAPASIVNTNSPAQVIQITLAAGANTITVPANAVGVIVLFDPTSTTVKTLKGLNADTGIVVSKNKMLVLTFDSPPTASFVLDSTGADTGKTTEITFF